MLTNKTLLKNYRLAKKINHNNDSVYWRDINNLKKFNIQNFLIRTVYLICTKTLIALISKKVIKKISYFLFNISK